MKRKRMARKKHTVNRGGSFKRADIATYPMSSEGNGRGGHIN